MKIKKQLYIVFLLAAFIPTLVIGSYLILTTRNIIKNQHYSQVEFDNTRVKSILLDVTTSISNISDNIFNDDQLKNMISIQYEDTNDFYRVSRNYNRITSYLKNYMELFDINVYVDNETITDYGNIKKVTDYIRNESWYQEALNTSSYLWMSVDIKDRGGKDITVLRHVRKIPLVKTGGVAVLTIDVSNNYLKSRIENNDLITDISVDDKPIFYSTNNINVGKLLGTDIDYEQKYYLYKGVLEYNSSKALVNISTQIPLRSSNRFYVVTVDKAAVSDLQQISIFCIVIVILCLIVPFIMIMVFTHTFSSRIITLREDMHKVSSGNYNITEQFNGNDELYELYQDLITMIQSIKKMDQEIYNERISKQQLINHQQQMEFQMLSSQINPHFLYNTLETIRMKAFNAGDLEVATAIKLLGKSLRYVLEHSEKSATLQSELEYIQIYLSIIKLRFEDKFTYNIIVDQEIDPNEYRILPLLLQPIVENAILHGFEDVENSGILEISIKKEENKAVIIVKDNGSGIPESELTKLLLNIHSNKSSSRYGIGLFNISQRIKLFYGKEYGMNIESSLGEGTKVLLYLPLTFDWRLENDEGFYSG